VHNYDFWWHLATGKYIVESKSLPENDPFSYTAKDTPSERKTVILKGNWLAQVIFYKVYSLWESKGIIILRSLLLLLFLYFVFLTTRKQNSSDLIALILIAGVFLLARTFPGERPQLFTFFVFSLVYYLLEDFRINRSKKIFFIPVLVMLLSNMHPGYIVVILLITLYLLGEGARCLISRDYKGSIFKGLLMIWVLTVIFSMLNPNGATMLTLIFSIHGEYIQGIVEFQPTFSLYLNKLTPINYSYIAFLIFSLLSLRYVRKIGLIHMLMLIVFTYMSFVALRYVIFYMAVSAPIIARIIINLKEERLFKRLSGILKAREGLLYFGMCTIGVFLVFNAIPSFAKYSFKADTTYNVPKGAADFLSNLEIKGNMFNEYGFGGYLIWRLYPEKKVFIDGRLLAVDVYREYQVVAYAAEGPKQSWEDIIKRYNFSYIIIPPIQYQGTIFPIVEKLFDSEDWVLIYTDHQSFVFIRNNPENIPIIKKFAIDKMKGLNTIIIQAIIRANRNPVNPYFFISLGKVFFKMGKLEDAEKAFRMAYERDPGNVVIKEWLKAVKDNREKYGVKED